MIPENLFVSESSMNLISPSPTLIFEHIEVAGLVVEQPIETKLLVGPSKSVQDIETTSVVEIVVAAPGKELIVFAAPDSPELEITDEFTMENILANLIGINAIVCKIRND